VSNSKDEAFIIISIILSNRFLLEKMKVDQMVYRLLSPVDPEGSEPCPLKPN
jgi:hypothetical protein